MSQLGSVIQSRRTVMSNNWTDQLAPLVKEGEETESEAGVREEEEMSGSNYCSVGEESEWEELEEE